MPLRYLHTMVRVKDLDASLEFYGLLGLKETRRIENEKGRFTLIFLAPEGQEECPVELTYNWDGDDGLPSVRGFGLEVLGQAPQFELASLRTVGADVVSRWTRRS